MPAPGITLLKNNVPWGPFTRSQIDEGLLHGDFTVKYLAHTPGLKEWLPLGEVLHYFDERARRTAPPPPQLPPVPQEREIPPLPGAGSAPTATPFAPPTPPFSAPSAQTLAAPASPPAQVPGRPVAPPLPGTPVLRELKPELLQTPPAPPPAIPSSSSTNVAPFAPIAPAIVAADATPALCKAPFLRRAFAFVVDVLILFVPVGFLFLLGALAIEIPGAWNHISHQARMEKWDLLKQHVWQLSLIVAIGFGWLYGAGMESSKAQATVGKRWMGIKAADLHGGRMSFLRASGRYAAKYLSAAPFFLGFLLSLFSSRGLTLHDRLSGTRVLRS